MTSEELPVTTSADHTAQAGQQTASTSRERMLLLAIAIGTTLAPLNSTMIAIALPRIQDALTASVTSTSWLVTLYLVVMAAGLPIGGRFGDLYGRRRVYLIGLAWFGIASAGCAFAPNLLWLVVFRTQQGLAGALTFPNGAAMVREAIPEARRGTAFGMIGLATGVAAASGPPLGGLLVSLFGWSAIFWVNVPMVGAAILLGWRNLPHHRPARTSNSRFDFAGTILFTLSLGAIILIPTLLKLEKPLLALASGVAAVALAAGFVWWELRAREPVIDLRLFEESRFAAACLSIGLGNIVMYTTLLALPLYLEGVRGHSVQISGLVLAAMSAFSALLGPFSGRWTDRVGRWLPAVTGAGAVAMGTALLVIGVQTATVVVVIVALAVMGFGLGIAGAPVQTVAVEVVPSGKTGAAAGMFSTSRYLGSMIGTSILAVMFVEQPTAHEASRFVLLFAGLLVVAIAGIAANAHVATRHAKPT